MPLQLKPSRFSKKVGLATSGSRGSGNGSGWRLCVRSARALPGADALTSTRTCGWRCGLESAQAAGCRGGSSYFSTGCIIAHRRPDRGRVQYLEEVRAWRHVKEFEAAVLPRNGRVRPAVERNTHAVHRQLCEVRRQRAMCVSGRARAHVQTLSGTHQSGGGPRSSRSRAQPARRPQGRHTAGREDSACCRRNGGYHLLLDGFAVAAGDISPGWCSSPPVVHGPRVGSR